jgi:CubicO group peptidase (beta-lactamase class C family)
MSTDDELDPVQLVALVERARREVDEGFLPSCQLAVARGNRVCFEMTIGAADPTSRYRIFSATKALTAAAVWLVLQDGAVTVEQRVARAFGHGGAGGQIAWGGLRD